ncbi:MAG: class I SAM-dependent methyltransferase [Bacteroidota bacterium]|nr:class I SAM-dependent methyltransferase [Bacteroidota bacterium]
MELNEAAQMLANDHFSWRKEQWADLGCGSGTFTLALAGFLQPQSTIYAMDTDISALKQIPGNYNSVAIQKITGDFNKQVLSFKNLDGILMANSLHYVKDKYTFIREASDCLAEGGCFLLVEYDMEQANQWVPYPLSLASVTDLFHEAGFTLIRKLKERPSLFGRAKLYSVIIQR